MKHGCQEAGIEIELQGDGKRGQRNIVIRCTIRREGNKTVFSVNGKPQGKKAVVELCRSLSIQIDNLCQFLPQDKVVEFAAMTPVELLRSTQRAVASQEMIEMHEELKEFRRKQKDVQARAAVDQDTLNNLQHLHRMQEADVERMREREQIVKRVSMLEASRPFPAYRIARLQRNEARGKWREAQTELTKLENDVEPSMRAFNEKAHYKGQIETVVGERKAAITKADKQADVIEKKFKDLQDKHNELVGGHSAELNSGKTLKKDLARLELSIINLKKQMEQQPSEVDVAAYNERIRDRRRAIDTCQRQIRELQDQQREASQKGREKNSRIQQAHKDLQNLDSQAGKQQIKLQNLSRDTAKLWEWVQEHQDEFEKPVFGPPAISCSIKDPKYVDQVETLFRQSNMLSITCQTNNDLGKISDAAANQHLKDIYIRAMVVGLDHFKPPVEDEAQMKRYGFDGWALDHMNGPDPVLAMLCGEIKLHQTGIGLRDTSQQQFHLLQKSPVQQWVSGKTIHLITRRREYGDNATSTRVQPVRRGTVWTEQPVDLTAKRELQDNIQGWKEETDALKASNSEAQKKIEGYRDAMNEAADEEKAISAEKAAKQKALGEFKALPTKLAGLEEKESAAQTKMNGMRARLREIADQQDEIAMERAQIALDYADAVESLRACHDSLHEAEILLIEASSDCDILKERNRSNTELIQSQRRQVDDLAKENQRLTTEAKLLIESCERLLRGDTDEELKIFFRAQPIEQTPEELESEIDSEKARLELMHEGDGRVIRDYEQRQKKIETLTARLDEINNALGELGDKIKELRDKWEPELDDLVAKISDSFSTNMEQISCAGEVGVFKDEDFDQWAIHIRVKFRYAFPATFLLSSASPCITI